MQYKSRWLFLFVSLHLLLFNSAAFADLVYKLTASENTIVVGQQSVISVWANAEEADPNYGLITWGADLIANNSGILQVIESPTVEVNILEPQPLDSSSGWLSVNEDANADAFAGNVIGLNGNILNFSDQLDTSAGVGFTKVAEVTVKGLAVGTVTYSLMDIYDLGEGFFGELRDHTYYDVQDGNVSFVEDDNRIISVVPTPAPLSFMLLAAAARVLRRRKANSG